MAAIELDNLDELCGAGGLCHRPYSDRGLHVQENDTLTVKNTY